MTWLKITTMILATLAIIVFSHLESFSQIKKTGSPLLTDVASIAPDDLGDFPPAADGIRIFQARVRHNPRDAISLTVLGQLYLQQARETGNVALFQQAEATLERAIALSPNYAAANVTLAAAWYAQHNFTEALELAQQLYQDDPRRTEALMIMGDAYLALGQYEGAEVAYQELWQREETPPVLARLAHQAELQGDPDIALYLLQRAAGEMLAAGQAKRDMAWYLIRLADLYFKGGQLEDAAEHYETALRLVENYYVALAGLGKVRAAQGRYGEAIDLYQRAVAIIPQPDFLAALGDLYALNNQPDQARLQYDTVAYIGKLAEANEQVYNRQLALFYADHDLHVDQALTLATTELELRQDIYGLDTAAWAHYKNGLLNEAQALIKKAMAWGTRDPMLFYHAGMIAQAQGDSAEAKRLLTEALAINPHFDLLQASVAQTTLKQLQTN